MFEVNIREMPAMTLHGLLHKGPYHDIAQTFERLGLLLSQNGLMEQATLWAGVYCDDAGTTTPEELRSYACCALAPEVDAPDEMEPIEVPGGRAAVLSYKGDYAGLAEAWQWFDETWIAKNDLRKSEAACYEIYRTMAPAVPVEEQLTEIVQPVA